MKINNILILLLLISTIIVLLYNEYNNNTLIEANEANEANDSSNNDCTELLLDLSSNFSKYFIMDNGLTSYINDVQNFVSNIKNSETDISEDPEQLQKMVTLFSPFDIGPCTVYRFKPTSFKLPLQLSYIADNYVVSNNSNIQHVNKFPIRKNFLNKEIRKNHFIVKHDSESLLKFYWPTYDEDMEDDNAMWIYINTLLTKSFSYFQTLSFPNPYYNNVNSINDGHSLISGNIKSQCNNNFDYHDNMTDDDLPFAIINTIPIDNNNINIISLSDENYDILLSEAADGNIVPNNSRILHKIDTGVIEFKPNIMNALLDNCLGSITQLNFFVKNCENKVYFYNSSENRFLPANNLNLKINNEVIIENGCIDTNNCDSVNSKPPICHSHNNITHSHSRGAGGHMHSEDNLRNSNCELNSNLNFN